MVLREGGKGVTVKAVDCEPSRKTVEPADQLIGEALFDPGVVDSWPLGPSGDARELTRGSVTVVIPGGLLTSSQTLKITSVVGPPPPIFKGLEAGIAYDIKRIDDISRRIPCLCKVSPSSNYHVQDVHRAGGIHTILGELKRYGALQTECLTVTGRTLGENIDTLAARRDDRDRVANLAADERGADRGCARDPTDCG